MASSWRFANLAQAARVAANSFGDTIGVVEQGSGVSGSEVLQGEGRTVSVQKLLT